MGDAVCGTVQVNVAEKTGKVFIYELKEQSVLYTLMSFCVVNNVFDFVV